MYKHCEHVNITQHLYMYTHLGSQLATSTLQLALTLKKNFCWPWRRNNSQHIAQTTQHAYTNARHTLLNMHTQTTKQVLLESVQGLALHAQPHITMHQHTQYCQYTSATQHVINMLRLTCRSWHIKTKLMWKKQNKAVLEQHAYNNDVVAHILLWCAWIHSIVNCICHMVWWVVCTCCVCVERCEM